MTITRMTECIVYRSEKREDTYLYLRANQPLDDLPVELLESFGQAIEVMQLNLDVDTRLAQVDARAVQAALKNSGYFVQLPPKVPVEELITRTFS
ncbi:MAG: YcgL domain-containing protein [Xanthomonadales bacterium]|nr:YcgL domain-containing protein [Gammaproteobacteria bacterium]NNL04893.1 YcgL domain-containing protein [Xanthomonadales bacterium]